MPQLVKQGVDRIGMARRYTDLPALVDTIAVITLYLETITRFPDDGNPVLPQDFQSLGAIGH